MKIDFDKISTSRTKRWTENGKKRQQTRTFFQTLNPFNRNSQGVVKSRAEILYEINKEADAWIAEQNEG